MLMRFDPLREFDRLTGQLFGGGGLAMDAYRRGDELVIHFDLPGVEPDSIDLTTDENALTVSARREWQPEDGVEVISAERPQGTMTRRLFLGDALDFDRVEATYDNGVLTVRVPVAESAKPRKVEIASGNGRKQLAA